MEEHRSLIMKSLAFLGVVQIFINVDGGIIQDAGLH